MVEKDPFLNFISDLSEKIKISKEHKQIMERVNDPKAIIDESKASLDNLILTIKEKIESTVTNKENVPALSSTQTTPLTSTIIKVVSEEENNFQDFVGKLKGILAKPREISEDKTTTSSVSSLSASPVKSEGQEDTKKYVNVLNQPKTKKNKNTQNYVEELEKIKDGIQIEKEDTKVTEIKKLIEEYAEKYIKKAVGMMGESGGGTVAVQYANGGTMNGDLNVNGSYLSGGVNLLDIFALQPDLDNQTLSYNESNYDLSISSGNTVNLSSINTTFKANSGKYETTFTYVSSNSARLLIDLPYYIGVETENSSIRGTYKREYYIFPGGSPPPGSLLFRYKKITDYELIAQPSRSIIWVGVSGRWEITNSANPSPGYTVFAFCSGTPDQVPTYFWSTQTAPLTDIRVTIQDKSYYDIENIVMPTLINTAEVASDTATTVNTYSGYWESVYTNVNSNSAYYALTNQDTIFEKNVTIQGNLTALGTSTFQNTVFTTTSALSVVSLGPGPALYVYQAAGPYDIASFYDGDGVEVLHVGNAQGGGNPLGQVGINTSHPSAELTVNGAISSNGVITVLGGNSNQWNSAYTNLVTNSATYLSGSSDNKYFYKDINFTANANTKYSSGTRFGAITATLPSGVVVGDCIEFFDADGTWNTNSLIIDNNSYFIEGIFDRLSCNTRYGAFKLIYTGTDSVGWRIVPLPKHSVNSPTLASVTTNGQVITASSSQFNLIIDNTVDYFTFYINSTTQISLSNRYDMNNFANCSLSAFNATNVNIDTNPLFIQNTAILSSGSDNYYTLYYSNTGSSIVNVSYSQSVPRSLARDQVVIAYNQNSQESIDVANYYKNNRPIFSEVRTLGLNIPQAVYPARINTNGVYFCASGCDIDVPYEGCRKYDFISTSLVQTQIVDPIANYISTYPTTKYIVYMLDVPTLVVPDNLWGLSVLSATQIPSLGSNVSRTTFLRTGIYPTYITGALSADCIAYIDKLSSASTDGITLYKPRNRIYTEDSNDSAYIGLSYYSYPQTIASLSAYSVYRSGAASAISGTTGLTGIFMDQSSSWPYNTGNIAISSLAIWGTWGFNGRRYIAPNGPYRFNISGEGEVPGLSSMSYYTDPGCSGKLSFTGPGNGWYFNYTIESWNGAPHGGSYGYFGGSNFVGNRFWGSFPTSYTGVKTFSAFKASPQYSQGLRPVRHSCYTQYFAKNAFGSINYENTPVVYVGHSYEPFYPGALNSTFMRSWMEGSTAYVAITGNIANASPMVIIGDPLVKITLNSI